MILHNRLPLTKFWKKFADISTIIDINCTVATELKGMSRRRGNSVVLLELEKIAPNKSPVSGLTIRKTQWNWMVFYPVDSVIHLLYVTWVRWSQ